MWPTAVDKTKWEMAILTRSATLLAGTNSELWIELNKQFTSLCIISVAFSSLRFSFVTFSLLAPFQKNQIIISAFIQSNARFLLYFLDRPGIIDWFESWGLSKSFRCGERMFGLRILWLFLEAYIKSSGVVIIQILCYNLYRPLETQCCLNRGDYSASVQAHVSLRLHTKWIKLWGNIGNQRGRKTGWELIPSSSNLRCLIASHKSTRVWEKSSTNHRRRTLRPWAFLWVSD